MMSNILGQSAEDFIIIQARMSSKRFSGKMLSLIGGLPLVEYIYERSKRHYSKNVLIATSVDSSDDALYNLCLDKKIPVFRGSLSNVLDRYINAAIRFGAKNIVRICADTPFVDFSLCETLLEYLKSENVDYVSFVKETCLPCFYSEAFTLDALRKASALTKEDEDLEHMTRFFIRNPELFLIKLEKANLSPEFAKDFRLTIDYPEDLERVNAVINRLKDKFCFNSNELLEVARELIDDKNTVVS